MARQTWIFGERKAEHWKIVNQEIPTHWSEGDTHWGIKSFGNNWTIHPSESLVFGWPAQYGGWCTHHIGQSPAGIPYTGPFDQSPPVYKHQRPSNVRYIPSIDGMTGRPFKGQ